jgi:hypothetical protein
MKGEMPIPALVHDITPNLPKHIYRTVSSKRPHKRLTIVHKSYFQCAPIRATEKMSKESFNIFLCILLAVIVIMETSYP